MSINFVIFINPYKQHFTIWIIWKEDAGSDCSELPKHCRVLRFIWLHILQTTNTLVARPLSTLLDLCTIPLMKNKNIQSEDYKNAWEGLDTVRLKQTIKIYKSF